MIIGTDITLISGIDLALAEANLLPDRQIRTLQLKAVVDPQISMLLIPESIKDDLGLDLAEIRMTEINGQWIQAEIYRYVRVQFENRQAIADAYVIQNQTEVVIGRSLMLAMNVVLDPDHRLTVNPESPDIARMLLM